MKGTIVNTVTIMAGSGLGLMLRQGIPKRYEQTVMQAIGLSVLLIGLQMAFKTENVLIIILSLVVGGMLGEFLNIQGKLDVFGDWLTRKAGRYSDSNVGQAFITSSLVYCVGAMAIVGSLQDGLTGDANTLYAKSMLDGISAIVFTATMGIGVILSSLSVLIYQGSITLLAGVLSQWLSPDMIREMTATGGLLIVGIGFIMLEIKKIAVANLLPAIPAALLITYLWPKG